MTKLLRILLAASLTLSVALAGCAGDDESTDTGLGDDTGGLDNDTLGGDTNDTFGDDNETNETSDNLTADNTTTSG